MDTVTMSLEKYDSLKTSIRVAADDLNKATDELKNEIEENKMKHEKELEALKETYEGQLEAYRSLFSLEESFLGKVTLNIKVNDAVSIFNDLFKNSEFSKTHVIKANEYSDTLTTEVAEYHISASPKEDEEHKE